MSTVYKHIKAHEQQDKVLELVGEQVLVREVSILQQQQLATRSTLNPEAEDWTLRFGRTPRQMAAAFVPQLSRVDSGRSDSREA